MNVPEMETLRYLCGAIIHQWWRLNGKWHREDGPAHIDYYESGAVRYQEWSLNGKRHREDGPAVIRYHKSGAIKSQQYWWNGTKYPDIKTDEGWTRRLLLHKIRDVMQS